MFKPITDPKTLFHISAVFIALQLLLGIGLTRPSILGLIIVQVFLMAVIAATAKFFIEKNEVKESFFTSQAILLTGSALVALVFSIVALGQSSPQGITFSTISVLYGRYIARYLLPLIPLFKEEKVEITIIFKEVTSKELSIKIIPANGLKLIGDATDTNTIPTNFN